MKLITHLASYEKTRASGGTVVALGNFDGLHIGHRRILGAVQEKAKRIKATSAVFTFKQHPRRVLASGMPPKILTSSEHKLYLLAAMNMDVCFMMNFTRAFSEMSAEEFVRLVLLKQIGMTAICMGENARFGHNRSGDAGFMKKMAEESGFDFQCISSEKVDGQTVSSSAIRAAILKGDLKLAEQFLGRPYSFFGTVVKGAGRGRTLGFPTANLDPHSEVMPPAGVYPVAARVLADANASLNIEDGYDYEIPTTKCFLKGVMNFGTRPTFEKGGAPIPEIYFFDFKGELLGQTVEVFVNHPIRGECKFKTPDALVQQIKTDISEASKRLNNIEAFLKNL